MNPLRHSALYHGHIGHRRFAPRQHAFSYSIGLLYLDLSEQEALLNLSPLAGNSRFSPFSFRETDYLPSYTDRGISLRDAVQQQVQQALGRAITGPIRLLTQPRSWGLSFNPVSFFYCFDEQERLQAILCEVRNTPFRERYHYVLPVDVNNSEPQQFAVAKAMHVSPFLPPDLEYRMRFNAPAERLGVHMADWQGELKLFDASLSLQRQPLTRSTLHRHLLSFPWMTGKTVLGIYWQALRLLLKRLPIFTQRPAKNSFSVARPLLQESADE